MVSLGGDICRLCLKESELRNSHILPEFLYADVYDEIHRALVISTGEEKYFQKGVREYLLCQQCETKLSRYEKYAKEIIQRIPSFSRDASGKFLYSNNVDYSQLKLFQLSILWRASISTNEAFKQVELGRHEEIIRRMIDKENPGNIYDYGCLMSIMLDTKILHKIIQSPTRFNKKFLGHNAYKFITGNLTWVFIVSSHRVAPNVQELLLHESGLLRVMLYPHDEDLEIVKIAKTFYKMDKK